MNRKKRNIIIGSLLTLAIISGGGYYFWNNKTKKEEEAKNAVQTVEVKKNNILNTVQTTGKVISNLDVEIKCKASGEIISLPYDISDKVKKGALLVKLSPVDEQRNVRQSEINLDQSRSALVKVEQDLLLAKSNFKTTRSQTGIDLETAQIKARDFKTKAQRSKSLYILSTQRKLAVAEAETAKIKFKELSDRAKRAETLYKKDNLLSQNDYETALSQAKQAALEVTNAQIRLKEQDTNSQNEYDSALTSSRQAEADVKNAQLKLSQQDNSTIEVNIKSQDIKSAQSKIEVDKIALLIARQRLKDTEVYSPIDGVVTVRTAQVGQIIASGISNVSGGTSVMTLSDLSKIYINASIDESDIGKVKIGQPATITVDAFPNQKFRGQVVQIASKGNNVSNVVTFPVKIEVKSKNKSVLKPEMTSNLEVIALRKNNVLTLPTDTVSRNKGKYFVTVLSGKEQKQKEVKIGVEDLENYEILSGLNEGDKVVSQSSSADGSKWSRNGAAGAAGGGVNARNVNRNVRRMTGGTAGGGNRKP